MIDQILHRLEGVRRSGNGQATALCPAHDDRHNSLSVGVGRDGRVLLHCHAGCSTEAVCDALGLRLSDLMPNEDPSSPTRKSRRTRRLVARYVYPDADGEPVFEVRRYEPKTFRQYRYENGRAVPGLGGVEPVLYRLPGVLRAARDGRVVFVCEGEKDADRLCDLGLVATTNPMGAGKWRDTYSESLRGAHVVILPDNDAPGRTHARDVAGSLWGIARSIRIVELPGLPAKGDASDWLEAGHTADELKAVCLRTPPLEGPPETTAAQTEAAGGMGAEAVAIRVADVERERIRWLWPGRLALGKITILDGDPGLGKSTLYCDLAARITKGLAWPDEAASSPAEPGSVVIVTCEDAIGDTIRPRLEEARADVRRVHVVQAVREGETTRTPALPEDIQAIEAVVRKEQACLLIVDPLMAHLGDRINAHRDSDIRRALTPLALLAERCHCAVLVVRHLNKQYGGDPLYRGGGSIGIIGQARFGLLLGNHPEHDKGEGVRVLAVTKSNVGAWRSSLMLRLVASEHDPDTAVIRWEGTTPLTASDLLVREKKERPRDEVASWLRERLAGGEPVRARDLYAEAEKLGFAEKTVKRAKKMLGVVSEQIPPMPGGLWYWSLPGSAAPEAQKSPEGHFAGIGPLGENGHVTNGKNGDSGQKTAILPGGHQRATSRGPVSSGPLGNGHREHALHMSSVPAPGTVVRLPDGREGTVTPTRKNGRIVVHLMDDGGPVWVDPGLLEELF